MQPKLNNGMLSLSRRIIRIHHNNLIITSIALSLITSLCSLCAVAKSPQAKGQTQNQAWQRFKRIIVSKALLGRDGKDKDNSMAKGNGMVIEVGAYPKEIIADGKRTCFIVAKVTDGAGKPIEGVKVKFESTDGEVLVKEAITDCDGIAISRLRSRRISSGRIRGDGEDGASDGKEVKVMVDVNPKVETTVKFVGADAGATATDESSVSSQLRIAWWSVAGDNNSVVCTGDGGIAAGPSWITFHVRVPTDGAYYMVNVNYVEYRE